MKDFIIPKLPDTVTHAFIDSDPIAYAGAFAVQKARYQYTNIHTGEKSVLFPDAKRGKLWLTHQEEEATLFGFDFTSADWIRDKVVEMGDETEAKKASDKALEGYLRHVKGAEWAGFFTEKGEKKNKDIPGIEKRYQGNRGGLVSPFFLITCREHLMSKPQMTMVKNGFEADSIVIARAEKKGKAGVLLSLDKDLRQAENTYVIDMSYDVPMILYSGENGLGGVWQCPIKSDTAKKSSSTQVVVLNGLCSNLVLETKPDHYGGLKGVGAVRMVEILNRCQTKVDCLKTLYKELYEPHGKFEYTSWDGQEMSLSPAEMFLQHIRLAYQERSPSDNFTFERYGWTPE